MERGTHCIYFYITHYLQIKPVHVGTQTDDADTTLIDIELETSDKGSDNDSSKNEGN